jgi:hypothetical protein
MADRPASATAPEGSLFGWPWTLRWPPEAGGGALFNFAPERLWQPVNPGWTFGNVVVNTQNSSAPEIEQAVVSRQSYGRQIGRLMEAVQALAEVLEASNPGLAEDERLRDFQALACEIEAIKREAAGQRLARLKAELAALKRTDPAAWRKLMASAR